MCNSVKNAIWFDEFFVENHLKSWQMCLNVAFHTLTSITTQNKLTDKSHCLMIDGKANAQRHDLSHKYVLL